MLPLGYSTNAHTAEDAEALLATLVRFAGPARTRLGWDRLGLDLRLGSRAINDLMEPARLARFRRTLDRLGLSAHTLNGFPLGTFQDGVVKHGAYRPDWSEARRLSDSLALIGLALALSDEPLVTVSTVPGSYRCFAAAARPQELAGNLGTWAASAAQAKARTGRTVVLCLEPEPWCLLEHDHDVAWFWQGPLASAGVAAAAGILGGEAAGRAAIATHLGVCVDTCHLSLAFVDQADAIARMAASGARIAKCQVSAAPEVRTPANDAAGLAALRALDEPRFLHQTAARSAAGSIAKIEDLGQLDVLLGRMPEATAIRSHFHIPLFRPATTTGLSSTIADTRAGLAACLAHGCPHIAVETYTWPLMATDEAAILDGTVRELAWLQAAVAG